MLDVYNDRFLQRSIVKQSINPKLAIAIVVGALIIFAIGAMQIWRAPSAVPVNQKPLPRAQMDQMMRESHQGPTQEQLKKIQEWKQTHPGAYTKY